MELKTRALQLEEELFQVTLQPWGPCPTPPSILHADVQDRMGSGSSSASSGLVP